MSEENKERFVGISRLYGAEDAKRLAQTHCVVVGVGGVGSWAAEALCRSGVGKMTLIDPDCVCLSNTNRQVEALEGGYGRAKVEVLAERFRAINPEIRLTCKQETLAAENVAELLPEGALVLDCIDDVPAKTALIAYAVSHAMPIVVAGGAGGRKAPTCVRVADLSRVGGDALLAAVRTRLRKFYGFPAGGGKRPALFHVPAVYSDEPMVRVESSQGADGERLPGFGASVCVTATAGMTMAATLLGLWLQGGRDA